jgi:hypothetical protein
MEVMFEFFRPYDSYNPENERVQETRIVASKTEAENIARAWLKARHAETRNNIRPWMTRPEKREILAVLPWYHVNIEEVRP